MLERDKIDSGMKSGLEDKNTWDKEFSLEIVVVLQIIQSSGSQNRNKGLNLIAITNHASILENENWKKVKR